MPRPNETIVSWDDAQRCSKCEQVGAVVSDLPAREKYQGRVKILECQSELCPNYGVDGRWIVQIRPDGTIPVNTPRGIKSFPTLSEGAKAVALRGLEEAAGRDLREEFKDRG